MTLCRGTSVYLLLFATPALAPLLCLLCCACGLKMEGKFCCVMFAMAVGAAVLQNLIMEMNRMATTPNEHSPFGHSKA